MNRLLKFSLLVAIAMSSVFITACDGEDGDPGPQGEQGPAGNDGKDGEDGKDGDTFGYSTEYGNIVATYSGTRADGVAFTSTVDYKYAQGGNQAFLESYWREDAATGAGMRFANISRYELSKWGESISLSLNFDDKSATIGFSGLDTNVLCSDKKYIMLSLAGLPIQKETISSFLFTAPTGELKLKYDATFISDRAGNHWSNANVALDINVKLYEQFITPQ